MKFTNPDIAALADEIDEAHREWYRDNPQDEVMTTCLIVSETQEAMLISCPWSSAQERSLIIKMLRSLMIKERAVRYAIWSETWMIAEKGRKGQTAEEMAAEHDDTYETGDLALHPDRVEAIVTLVVEASGKTVSRISKIIRGKGGGVTVLEPMFGMDGMGGVLADLMPKREFN